MHDLVKHELVEFGSRRVCDVCANNLLNGKPAHICKL
ncbi:MAG: hypothetical protein ACJAXW_004207 [Candidatus Azotimanducaceae bacterium]|jgi:hypothetical protein